MSGKSQKALSEDKTVEEDSLEGMLEENELFRYLNREYDSIKLLAQDPVGLDEIDSFSSFDDVEYGERFDEDNMAVVVYPDFLDKNQEEDTFDLTQMILEKDVDAVVFPSYAEGQDVYPALSSDGMEKKDSYWFQEGFRAKPILYEKVNTESYFYHPL